MEQKRLARELSRRYFLWKTGMPLKLQPRNIIRQRDITFTERHSAGYQTGIQIQHSEDESYDMKYDNQLQKAISVVKKKNKLKGNNEKENVYGELSVLR